MIRDNSIVVCYGTYGNISVDLTIPSVLGIAIDFVCGVFPPIVHETKRSSACTSVSYCVCVRTNLCMLVVLLIIYMIFVHFVVYV